MNKNISAKLLTEAEKAKLRLKRFGLGCFVAALISASAASLSTKFDVSIPNHFSTGHHVVAHAGGGLKDESGFVQKYLNCREAFDYHYNQGTRLFEYDLAFSCDGKLISTHNYEYLGDYSQKNRISYEEFCNTKIAGKYTGINEDNLFDLIKNYPDARFIVDTKEDHPIDLYRHIIKVAKEKDVDISSAIIPFVCSKEMLAEIEAIKKFDEYMFTNYKKYYNTNELVDILKSNEKIKYLHIFPIDFLRIDIERISKLGVRVFAHMDSYTPFKLPLQLGCSGVFSDDLTEKYFDAKFLSALKTKKVSPSAYNGKSNSYKQHPNKQNLYKQHPFKKIGNCFGF